VRGLRSRPEELELSYHGDVFVWAQQSTSSMRTEHGERRSVTLSVSRKPRELYDRLNMKKPSLSLNDLCAVGNI